MTPVLEPTTDGLGSVVVLDRAQRDATGKHSGDGLDDCDEDDFHLSFLSFTLHLV